MIPTVVYERDIRTVGDLIDALMDCSPHRLVTLAVHDTAAGDQCYISSPEWKGIMVCEGETQGPDQLPGILLYVDRGGY